MRPFHPQLILTALSKTLPYLWVTIAVMIATVVIGSLIGLLLTRANIRRRLIGGSIAQIYIYVTRCIPSIVLLFIVYYGLPELLLAFGININNASRAVFVITTFSILFSANMAEVFRSAYEAIDPGQREAALCAGLSEWQTFHRILLPQCTVIALPNFTNALVNLMKEGSLAYTIGLLDIMGKGQVMIGQNNGSFALETYLALAIVYWCMTLLIEKVFATLEKHLTRGQKILSDAP